MESAGAEFFPANGATNVSTSGSLEWMQNFVPTFHHTVKFGTNPETLQVLGSSATGRFVLPDLLPGTTYYWQIVSSGGSGVTSPLLSFTTRQPIIVTKTQDEPAADVASIPGVSLREAVMIANENPGLDFIHFHPQLAGQEIEPTYSLEITSELRIDGQSVPGGITLRGNLFIVRAATEFQNLAILDGYSSGSYSPLHLLANFTARNCTISGGRGNRGGGIRLQNGTCTLIHCTITRNQANLEGGGIYRSGGTLILENSIVAGNRSLEKYPDIRATGSVTLRGNNLIGDHSGSEMMLPAGPLTGTGAAPISGALASAARYSDGSSAHCALLPGSPARGQALPLATTPPLDQIGNPRPGDSEADLGAIEFLASVPVTVPGNGVTEVTTRPELCWSTPGSSFEIFFGTDPANLATLGTTTQGFFELPELAHNTTYYWRVDSTMAGVTTTGPVHSFTTRGKIVVTTLLDENDAIPAAGTGISLREAIALAAARPGPDHISFATELSGLTLSTSIPLIIIISSECTIDASDLPEGITFNLDGSGFSISQFGQVTIRRMNVTASSRPALGTAFSVDGTLTLLDLSVYGIAGGGGAAVNNDGRFIAERCSFFGNRSATVGGALELGDGMSRLINCTLQGNHSETNGGAIFCAGETEIIHCTISGNTAKESGGIALNSSLCILENSIVAGNEAPLAPARSDIGGSSSYITPRGSNLIGINTGIEAKFPAGPLAGTLEAPLDPRLFPFARRGGPTPTFAYSPDSPAIDAGSAASPPLSVDQRGSARPSGPASDLGSFESVKDESVFHPHDSAAALSFNETFRWFFHPGANLYRVLLGASGGPLEEIGTTTSNQLAVTLAPGTSYQWQVVAITADGSIASPVISFGTRSTIVVDTLSDENDPTAADGEGISLREAVAIAEAVPGKDRIVVSPAVEGDTLHLTKGEILLSSDVEIDGSLSSGSLIIDAGKLSRIFRSDAWYGKVELANLTVQQGFTTASGGAIANSGEMILRNTNLLHNEAEYVGGAIFNLSTGRLQLDSCNLLSNSSRDDGTCIFGERTPLRAENCTFAYSKPAAGRESDYQPTIVAKDARITNCTLANNRGGNVLKLESGVLTHTTITKNRSLHSGATIEWRDNLTLRNCIVAGNTGGINFTESNVRPELYPDRGSLTLEGNNLIGNNLGIESLLPAGPLVGTAAASLWPQLLDLGDHGGRTLTMPPQGGSLARGAAAPINEAPASDQRGRPRTSGITPDLGAVDQSGVTEALYPQNNATDISMRPQLAWIYQADAATYDVFLGPSPTTMERIGSTTSSWIDVPTLAPGTNYFWKIVAQVDGGAIESSVHHFTTRGTITVRDGGDPSIRQPTSLSLRQALNTAEHLPGHDFILLDETMLPGQGITLGGESLDVAGGVSILSKSRITGIGADGKSRIFTVWPDSYCELEGLDIHDGMDSSSGGGISASYANLSMNRCLLRNNRVVSSSNYTGGGGLTASNCAVEMTSCLVSGTQGSVSGGGIRIYHGALVARNSTFSANSAKEGGAIEGSGTKLKLEHCTITGNIATRYAGGIVASSWQPLELSNCIIAGNKVEGSSVSVPGHDLFMESFSFQDIRPSGANLIGNNSSCSTVFPAGPRVGTPAAPLDAKLSPIGLQGGGIPCHVPLPGSPAIDAAVILPGSPAYDQRGLPRPLGSGPDIGAIEVFSTGLALLDTDGDGMDDRLEVVHGLTVGVQDGHLDSDGDGSNNAEELGNRTNPHDAADRLRIISMTPLSSPSGGEAPVMKLTWTSSPGLNYTLELSEDLNFGGANSREVDAGTAEGFSRTFETPVRPGKDFIRIRRD